MPIFPTPTHNSRIGFHYYPDTDHYRVRDLRAWLPRLKSLGASWLTLTAPPDRAIPEPFLSGLLEADIEPVLQFQLPLIDPPAPAELTLLFSAYAHWGIHYAVLFNRPNNRAAWTPATWAQTDLVERFLDRYIPLADAAQEAGLIPVFPPLEPGGGYWDTSFLRASLESLKRRGAHNLLDNLVLSGVAPAGDKPINWGSGGPERWPAARPYITPKGAQDQGGFRIFDWYLAISNSVLGSARPILLFEAGSYPSGMDVRIGRSSTDHAVKNLLIARELKDGEPQETLDWPQRDSSLPPLDPIPMQVLGCSFWLLAAEPGTSQASAAWISPGGDPTPSATLLENWIARGEKSPAWKTQSRNTKAARKGIEGNQHPISHYLLLPAFEWGVTDWHLNAARPFIRKHRPVVGFSLAEAAFAARVTVVGGAQQFPETELNALRAAGCYVERITGDGTEIASQLAEK